MAISSGLGSSALLPAGLGFRNLIINGAMNVDQRNTATTAVTTNAYTVDRWYVENGSDAVLSSQQSTDVPAGQGFNKSLKVTATTADASIGATQYAVITQHIEGSNSAQLAWGASGAKPVVVSFWVKATVTGTYSFTLYNDGASRICPSSYTVNASNTWEKKTVYIVGDTSGTWLTTTGRGVVCNFYIALGTTYLGTSSVWNGSSIYGVTGQANALASTSNIFAITGVQLEQNLQPTPFEQRPYGTELALCQRYYRVQGQASGTGAYAYFVTGWSNTTLEAAFGFAIQPAMRSFPSIATSASSTFYIDRAPGSGAATSGSVQAVRADSLRINFSNAGSASVGGAAMLLQNNAAAAFFTFDAEL